MRIPHLPHAHDAGIAESLLVEFQKTKSESGPQVIRKRVYSVSTLPCPHFGVTGVSSDQLEQIQCILKNDLQRILSNKIGRETASLRDH